VTLNSLSVGGLAQEFFFLDLPHAVGVIIGFAALGCATTAFIATLGPQTGVCLQLDFGHLKVNVLVSTAPDDDYIPI
jgi:purine-cytosine permease-like protein